MNEREFSEQILDYLEDRLSAEERARFDAELYESGEKFALLRDYEELVTLEREASQLDSSYHPELTEEIMFQVRTKVRQQVGTEAFFGRRFFAGFAGTISVCLAAILLLGPMRIMREVEQYAFQDSAPSIPEGFETVSLSSKDGLPPVSKLRLGRDVEVIIELSSAGRRKVVSGVLRVGKAPRSNPVLILEEEDQKYLERVKALLGA